MPLSLLFNVFGACGDPVWSASRDAVELTVIRNSVAFGELRSLEADNIYAERLYHPSNQKIQNDFDSGNAGELPKGATFKLKLPRVINECVVAKNLADLLSIDSATYRQPKSFFLLSIEDSGKPFCSTDQSNFERSPLLQRYENAISLWAILKEQADHTVPATNTLLFFGLGKTEVAPGFTVADLEDAQISVEEIAQFINDQDRETTRKEIFRSVLAEFLKDQRPARAFSYFLRQGVMFARRLREGLAIYLSEHSPEKLAEDARLKYLELAEKLEKIVAGMEAKSLTIPAAVLLAVKEVEFGKHWTTLNAIILISTALYFLAMFFVFLSQRTILKLLKVTIENTEMELTQKGLDGHNPVLLEGFTNLKRRRAHTSCGSSVIIISSLIPIAAVVYGMFFAAPSLPSSYSVTITPTNGVQIIQNQSLHTPTLVPTTNGHVTPNAISLTNSTP